MKLALLDVGHGNCVVVHWRGRAIVVDCPPGRILHDYLLAERIAIVRDMVISHADKDHSGGLPSLVESGIAVRRVWIADDQSNDTTHYKQIIGAFSAARRQGAIIERGYPHADAGPLTANGIVVEFLSPQHENRMIAGNRNRMSVMVRVSYQGHGVALLPGDIDAAGYQLLVDEGRDYSADWLVAPHHGGLGGTLAATEGLLRSLLRRTGAKALFFSFARSGPHVFPRKELVELVRSEFPDTSVVCSQLSFRCAQEHPLRLSGPSFHYPFSEGIKRGNMRSCAGSVVLELAKGSNWSHIHEHRKLVASVGEDAMCTG